MAAAPTSLGNAGPKGPDFDRTPAMAAGVRQEDDMIFAGVCALVLIGSIGHGAIDRILIWERAIQDYDNARQAWEQHVSSWGRL